MNRSVAAIKMGWIWPRTPLAYTSDSKKQAKAASAKPSLWRRRSAFRCSIGTAPSDTLQIHS